MDNHLEKIKHSWQIFMETGCIEGEVRPVVAEGWKRCRKLGINEKTGIGKQADCAFLEKTMAENAAFISISKPIIRELYHSLAHSDSSIFITDRDGCILELFRDSSAKALMEEAHLESGYIWCEAENGLSSMALTMRLDAPVHLAGPEHYCENHHIATGASAPIHDETGRIIGSMNLISRVEQYSKHSLGVVSAGAVLIEKQMHLLGTLNLFRKTFNSMSEGMILVNQDGIIHEINVSACKILGIDAESVTDIGQILEDFFTEGIKKGKTVDLKFQAARRTCRCIGEIDRVDFGQNTSFYSIVFKEDKTLNKMANKITGNTASYTFDQIVTSDEATMALMAYAKKTADIDCCVLISGPSGTGKELFAQSIHNSSKRKKGPFIAINCAALPADLVESELFGYETGAFTGAKHGGQPGKIELAEGGTLFLDEVGELPLNIQSKLLRFLDNRRVTRLGGKDEKEIDVRMITATNRNLEEEVRAKNFRLDLFYRINMITLKLPELNERTGDIALLAHYFLQKLNRENDRFIHSIHPEVVALFENFEWEGNVRQLQNIVTRAYYLCEGQQITKKDLPENMQCRATSNIKPAQPKQEVALPPKEDTLKAFERELIIETIEACKGNMTQVAKTLNMAKSTLYRKIKAHKIEIKRTVFEFKT